MSCSSMRCCVSPQACAVYEGARTDCVMKKLPHSYVLLVLLLSLHSCVNGASLCVARLQLGDEFVNEGGATAVCAEFGASCATRARNLQCGCDINEPTRPCSACKCSTTHPIFNGTKCKLLCINLY